MKKILLLMCAIVVAWGSYAQNITVSGTVTSAEDGSALPGVNVLVKGTTNGTATDADGKYSISVPSSGAALVFSFIGLKAQEIEVGGRTTIDIALSLDATELSEVVVTALGVSREVKTLPYASQQVKSENLNITQDSDIKGALAGKVAGVSIAGQAGSKLGQFGKIRIRGSLSLTNDSDPLYVVDGVPVSDPNDVDMNNVESVNVLKGPNATALYGQRAEAGVVVITTKRGSNKMAVEILSTTTFDQVSILPKYQNKYGGGYEGDGSWGTFDFAGGGDGGPYPAEWSVFDGKRHITYDNNYADESWGPKFDGQDYIPWYAWWQGTADNPNPYFGKTAKYEAQPDNIRNFYNTGVSSKNTVSVSGGGNNYSVRVSYSNLNQSGITPNTHLDKNFITTNFDFSPVEKLKITSNVRYTTSEITGDYDDAYGNQTSGSFGSWFNRQLDTKIMKELKDLQTPDGYSASWNWWGPETYTVFRSDNGYRKPAFWFNPYTFMDQYKQNRKNANIAGGLTAAYQIGDFNVSATAQRNVTEYKFDYYFPFYMSNSAAPGLYNSWSNSFGKYRRTEGETNLSANITYAKRFNDFDVNGLVGGNIRNNTYQNFSAQMPDDAKTGGLIIPDVYTFSNAGIVPVPTTQIWEKQVNSIYGKVSLGYKDMLYLDATYRKDWSSALPANKNGYGYPSIGTSFVFSELIQNMPALSFAKVRASWAQVGNDVAANLINPTYTTGSQPFNGKILMYAPTQLVDPNITPSLNTSIETGLDARFFNGRVGFSFTYYNETKKDEIIPVSVPRGSGYDTYLTNAGETLRRGIELSIDGDVVKNTSGLTWNIMFNIGTYNTTVESLPGDLQAITGVGGTGSFNFISVINQLGAKWGQLRGTRIARDANGNKIIQASGLYATEANHYYGSIIPDFSGGVVNRLVYKGFTLAASLDFQKGGKFFSLTEQWGTSSGLMEATAATNDNGKNVRDDVAEGGGVHVTGVDAGGAPVDMYVDAHTYFSQWYSNLLAEPFVHDKSYVKLRDVSLTYNFTKLLNLKFIKGAEIGVVGRNLWLISVAKDNTHRWDPSVLSTNYGENGQLPGTRSYGVNVKLTF